MSRGMFMFGMMIMNRLRLVAERLFIRLLKSNMLIRIPVRKNYDVCSGMVKIC
jgi:hypothetical protein